jgi:hypothetical protein
MRRNRILRVQTVGIFAGVGHAKETLFRMLQFEVLVFKFVSVDGFSTRSITLGEITTLDHELLDDTMEPGAFIAEAFFTCCQGTEVLRSLSMPSAHKSQQQGRRGQTFGTVLPYRPITTLPRGSPFCSMSK